MTAGKKYWTIAFPGEFGQSVVETWTEDQIMEAYYPYWKSRMIEADQHSLITKERCLEDWITVHWAVETDEWGEPVYPPIELMGS